MIEIYDICFQKILRLLRVEEKMSEGEYETMKRS